MKAIGIATLLLATTVCTAAEPITDPAKVTIRDDQTLLVNGKPFFLLGLYNVQEAIADESGAKLRELGDMGFNAIIYHGQPKTEELDRIAAAGLRVWYRPPGALYKALDKLPDIVGAVKNHPAMLLWEVQDEPVLNNVSFEETKAGVALLKTLDSDHLVLCNQYPDLGKADQLRPWSTIADVIAFDFYPLPVRDWKTFFGGYVPEGDRTIAVMGRLTRAFVTDIAANKPVIGVLQAWNWDSLKYGTEGYPTRNQARYMAYQCVINGVKGITYYGQVHISKPNAMVLASIDKDPDKAATDFAKAMEMHAAFWAQHKLVMQELNAMAPVFESPDAHDPVTISATPDSLIEHQVKQVGDVPVMLVVNSSEHGTDVSIKWLPAGATIHAWHQDRTIETSQSGVFTDKLEPFAVRIYAPAPMDGTLETLK